MVLRVVFMREKPMKGGTRELLEGRRPAYS